MKYNTHGETFTKEEIKQDIITAGRRDVKRLESYKNPTSHAYISLFYNILRLEKRLAAEYNMSETEIYNALH